MFFVKKVREVIIGRFPFLLCKPFEEVDRSTIPFNTFVTA